MNNQLEPVKKFVVTFVVGHSKASVLLLAARKRAQEMGVGWRVVHIDCVEQGAQAAHQHQKVLNLITRAKQMGAQIEHMTAANMTRGVEEFLRNQGGQVACVIIGTSDERGWLRRRLSAPQWVKMVQLAGRYTKVESVPLGGQFRRSLGSRVFGALRRVKPLHILWGLLGVAIPAGIAVALQKMVPPAFFRINEQNIDNLFLITIAIIAGRFGIVPGVFAAVAGFLVENYYFTLPYEHFKLTSATDLFSMALFLTAATLIAFFTSHMRSYTEKVKKREMHTEMLFTLYKLTSESFTRKQAIDILQQNLESMLQAKVAIFLPRAVQPEELEVAAPSSFELGENDALALKACWSDLKATGAASPFNPGTAWRFEPMVTASGEIGVLGVKPKRAADMDAWFGRLLEATADQSAAILTHIELERSMEATRISEEREKLRVMLLSSVSHDLKTPLAGIIGSLSAFLTLGDRLKPEQWQDLIKGSLEEAQSLDSFITNILDMTRLETGNIQFRREWMNVRELTEGARKHVAHRLKQRELVLDMPRSDVEASMDAIMTGQVLQNLLDNACKYTPPDTRIEVSWRVLEEGGITCCVRDFGAGIPAEKLANVFDKYTRLHKKDTQTPGTGLGLAIAKAIMEAQGGWIKAANHPEGGAMFTLFLPQWRSAPAIIEKEKSHAVK